MCVCVCVYYVLARVQQNNILLVHISYDIYYSTCILNLCVHVCVSGVDSIHNCSLHTRSTVLIFFSLQFIQ